MSRMRKLWGVAAVLMLAVNLEAQSFESVSTSSALASLDGAIEASAPKDGKVICNNKIAAVAYNQGVLPPGTAIALYIKQLKQISSALKKSKKKSAQKKLTKQSSKLTGLIKTIKSNVKACKNGQIAKKSGGAPLAASGLSLSGTTPAPDAQGNIVVTDLPMVNGKYVLTFNGQGFMPGQQLEAIINGNRTVSVANQVTGPNATTFKIRLANPITAGIDFTVKQTTSLGILISNTLHINLLSSNISGGIGDHVATLEHQPPSGVSDYVIDGNIPLPKGTFLDSDMAAGVSGFAVDVGGNLIPLDTTGITRYANHTQDGFDIVNVAARVPVQANSSMTSYKVYRIINQGVAIPTVGADAKALVQNAPMALHPSIRQLFSQPGQIVAEAADVFGNLYHCDLTQNTSGSVKLYTYGSSKLVFRVNCMTVPDAPQSGSNATLPHLMSVSAYFYLTAGDEALRLTVVAGNTVSGKPTNNNDARATALADLFFKFFRIKVQGDRGVKYVWRTPATPNPLFQNGFTLIDFMPQRTDGKMNFIPMRKTASFEVALHNQSALGSAQGTVLAEYQGQAFSAEGVSATNPNLKLYSPHNLYTARFGITPGLAWPTLYHMGITSVRNTLNTRFSTTNNYIQSGVCKLNKKLEDDPTPPSGAHACLLKTWRYFCDYPYLGSQVVHNEFRDNLPIDPNNPNTYAPGTSVTSNSNCHEDTSGPAPYSDPAQSPQVIPWGVEYGGMTGGSELFAYGNGFDVWAARSRNGLREVLLYMNSRLARQQQLTLLDGRPFSPLDAIRSSANGPYIPVSGFNGYNTTGQTACSQCDTLFGFNQAPLAQVNYVQANSLAGPIYNELGAFTNEDDQHFLRVSNAIIAVLQLIGHPQSIDAATNLGLYAYFTNPHLPQSYNGSTPVYQSGNLFGFHKAVPSAGAVIGRAFAHMQAMRTLATSLDLSFKAFMQPYHAYVASDIMYWAQMWNGLVRNDPSNPAKNSPLGQCAVSTYFENMFLMISNKATIERALDGVEPAAAANMTNVLAEVGSSILIPELVVPSNSWHAPFRMVMVSHSSNPNQIFTSWSQVPAACQQDAYNAGAQAGEQNYLHALADQALPNAALWGQLKGFLSAKGFNASTTLGKLQQITSLYSLANAPYYLVNALGHCQAMEQAVPGYCG